MSRVIIRSAARQMFIQVRLSACPAPHIPASEILPLIPSSCG